MSWLCLITLRGHRSVAFEAGLSPGKVELVTAQTFPITQGGHRGDHLGLALLGDTSPTGYAALAVREVVVLALVTDPIASQVLKGLGVGRNILGVGAAVTV